MPLANFCRGELLTLTGGIVQCWKGHFEEVLTLTNTSSMEEAEFLSWTIHPFDVVWRLGTGPVDRQTQFCLDPLLEKSDWIASPIMSSLLSHFGKLPFTQAFYCKKKVLTYRL